MCHAPIDKVTGKNSKTAKLLEVPKQSGEGGSFSTQYSFFITFRYVVNFFITTANGLPIWAAEVSVSKNGLRYFFYFPNCTTSLVSTI